MRLLPCGMTQKYDPPHFLESYILCAGIGKPPPPFHLWCGLSLLSAAVQDRISFTRVAGNPMPPNLFTILIGDSATGKGTAMHHATRIARTCVPSAQQRMLLMQGKATPQALISHMSGKNIERPACWFVTPELSMSVGTGSKADDFVRHFTGMYEGLEDLVDLTRMYGEKQIHGRLVLNWLAASTMEWIIDSVSPSAIESGFFGRVCGVRCPRKAKIPTNPIYPAGHQQLFDYLVNYIEHLTQLEAPMAISIAADQTFDHWYQTRVEPQSRALMPFWDRQDDLVYKLAQLLAVGDHYQTMIDVRHMVDAIALSNWLLSILPDLVEHANRGKMQSAHHIQYVIDWFRREPSVWVARTPLVREVSSRRGVYTPELNKIIATLLDRGDIECTNPKDPYGRGVWYRWVGGTGIPPADFGQR